MDYLYYTPETRHIAEMYLQRITGGSGGGGGGGRAEGEQIRSLSTKKVAH